MLREFRVNGADAPAAYFVADTALKTGMGVQKDYGAGKAVLPTAATADGIFLVAKAPIATGIYAGTDQSDYFDEYNTVAEGDTVVLYSYREDSAFGTDQFADTLKTALTTDDASPIYVAVGTDGKWAAAAGTSKYLATGMYDDAGHELVHIEVIEAGSVAEESSSQ